MGLAGQLTKQQFGFSLPVDASLYYPLPIVYKDVRMMLFDYLTDAAAAAALLPAPLELTDVPGQPNQALVKLLFADYPWTTLGPYREVAQALVCTFQGKPLLYAVRLHVTADTAMAAGREIAGFPKKLGHIEFVEEESFFCHLERPRGLRICTAALQPISRILTIPIPAGAPPKLPPPYNMTVPLPPATGQPLPLVLPFASLRVIPNPVEGSAPSLAQLITTMWLLESGEIWSATGSCQFTGASNFDPYHKLPILSAPIDCLLFQGDMQIAANAQVLQNL